MCRSKTGDGYPDHVESLGSADQSCRGHHSSVGVYEGRLTSLLGNVLMHLGSQHCFVVHGMDGLDEITLTEKTQISEAKGGVLSNYLLDPAEFGLALVPAKQLAGGTPQENAAITRDILQGRKGPKRDIVCLNAAPALVAGRKATSSSRRISLGRPSDRFWGRGGETGSPHRIYE